jgi:hypothetical protein
VLSCNDPATLVLYWLNPQALSSDCGWALQSSAQIVSVPLLTYLKVFLITNILESPFYFWVLQKYSWKQKILTLLCANLLTHPFVYFVFPMIFARMNLSYASYLTTAEAFAFIVEILFVCRVLKTDKLKTSTALFLANIFSWWIGLLLSR